MNDDFLHDHRKAPPPEFARRLYQTLQEEPMTLSAVSPAPRRARFWNTRAVAALVLIAFGVLFLLQPRDSMTIATAIALTPTSAESAAVAITAQNVAQLTEVARYGTGNISDVVWKGERLVVGGALGVWLYNTDNLIRPLYHFETQTTQANRDVDYHAVSGRIAATDGDRATVWDSGGNVLLTLDAAPGNTFAQVSLNADGSTVFASQSYQTENAASFSVVEAWTIDTATLLYEQATSTNNVYAIASSTDPTAFAHVTAEGIFLSRLDDGRIERARNDDDRPFGNNLVYSPNGSLIAVSTEAGFAIVRARDGAIVTQRPLNNGSPDDIRSMSFSPDNSELAIIAGRPGVYVWNLLEQRLTVPSADETAFNIAVAYNNDSDETGIAIVEGGDITLREVASGSLIGQLNHFASIAYGMVLSPDNTTAAMIETNGVIRLTNLLTGRETRIPASEDRDLFINSLSFSPDSQHIAYAATQLGDMSMAVNRLGIINPKTLEKRELYADQTMYQLVTYSPDGERLAVSSHQLMQGTTAIELLALDNVLATESPQIIADFVSPISMAYSHDGSLFAYLKKDNTLTFLKVPDYVATLDTALDNPLRNVTAFAFSQTAPLIAIAESETGRNNQEGIRVRVLNYETGETITRLIYLPSQGFLSLSFNPANDLLVTISHGAVAPTLNVWDTTNGRALFSPETSNEWVSAANFTADGNALVTTGADGLVRVWRVKE